jgi:hypothetical protein
MSDTSDLTYEQGYTEGESNHHADWDFALDELLPDGVEPWPTQVRDYIRRLQDDAILAGILRRLVTNKQPDPFGKPQPNGRLSYSGALWFDRPVLVLSDTEAAAIRRVLEQ